MNNYKTIHGFNDDEVVSALQKQIRRGIEDDAMYWALELCENGKNKNGFILLKNRLYTIAYEDIGLGDPSNVLNVSIAIRDMEKMYKKEHESWKLILSYIILTLCRSKKSRITDDFYQYINYIWNNKKPEEMELEIPDYALDMHTKKGNKKGRKKNTINGLKHFLEHGIYIENENEEIENIYKSQVREIWLKTKK